ncbi:30S ribosomal protein S1 [Alloacidobacterium dinghuense]|uniref:30S ribosomal protein S1 n=1 Tax=Alloacidobacterium dinghuense TaxID=2763107 RepID=A0A7G8BMC1_9BACT|nr:30S ribosomal protein S1 [Alloacidobacterium dinghuense]QNI33691.1 30S ribosomal protein S1 [Alloacidobacterium dinghuense]
MSNSNLPESQSTDETTVENNESFGELLSQFEQSRSHKAEADDKQREGTVISTSSDFVFVDIGLKIEGVLPVALFGETEMPKPGAQLQVSVKGRNEEGYYELSLFKIAQPKDWSSLERVFAEKTAISGTVTGVVKGGVTVDVGVRAFMPASRSGVRDAAEMEKLIGQEIVCRIIKLDVADEDVVVDRRVVMEEQQQSLREERYAEVREGDLVQGTVRSLTDYGAFVDLGGVDGLLHVSDIAWNRITNPADVLSEGQHIEVKVLKIDSDKRRISLGLKQLQKHPWDDVGEKFKIGDRVRGTVARLADFGAFVELEAGIEGLIHVSEMSWGKKVRKPSDILKQGDTVDAVILGVNAGERRISLGLKQALGDPWADASQRFPVGSQIEAPVTSFTKFGAFIQLIEGVEGMVHVSEISVDKHIHHPQDVLRKGEQVKVLVLAVDAEKRQIRLSMKQLIPTSLDEYLAEHKLGDVVSGRTMEAPRADSTEPIRVELGEGILGYSTLKNLASAPEASQDVGKVDLASLSSMLKARWKTGATPSASKTAPLQAGQIRSFRITHLDPAAKRIELELV